MNLPINDHDPVVTDPGLYTVIFENERVRILEYRDHPGDATHPHRHPDSVMVSLASFTRVVSSGGQKVRVELAPGQVRWLEAQQHRGENIGTGDSHALFIELKGDPASVDDHSSTDDTAATLGPGAAVNET